MFRKKRIEMDSAPEAELQQARDVLLSDKKILNRKVRRVAALGDRNGFALALYTCAAGHRFNWTPQDWNAVLDRLDSCDLTVLEWLDPCAKAKNTYHAEDNQGMCHNCGKPMSLSAWINYAGPTSDEEWRKMIELWEGSDAAIYKTA